MQILGVGTLVGDVHDSVNSQMSEMIILQLNGTIFLMEAILLQSGRVVNGYYSGCFFPHICLSVSGANSKLTIKV